jgi:hypothetical protein
MDKKVWQNKSMQGDVNNEFPPGWVERLVSYNKAQQELLSGLADEMILDGFENISFPEDDRVLSVEELQNQFEAVVIPSLDTCDNDFLRLSCVFVLGILGRWEEAIFYLGAPPGTNDRYNSELLTARLDILMAMSEHGRHQNVIEYGAAFAFDCYSMMKESSWCLIINTLRAESLARVGETIEALHLFTIVQDQLKEIDVDDNGVLMSSVQDHIDYLSLLRSF